MKSYKKYITVLLFFIFSVSINAMDSFSPFDVQLPNRFIKDIRESKSYIWIGTAKGLVRYDKRSKKSQVYNVTSGMPDDFITSIAIDSDENFVYAGTAGGMAQIDMNRNKVVSYTKRNSKLSDNQVNSVYVFNNLVFIGTSYGVDIYNPVSNQWKAYTAIEGLAGGNIQSISSDGYYVWTGGADGISYYDPNEDSWYGFGVDNGLTSNLVTSIVVNTDVIWVGTMGGGLNRFDRSSLRFDPYTTEEGLIDDNVQELIDDGKFLWVATFGGLSRLEKSNLLFTNYDAKNGLLEPSVTAGMVQGDTIFMGTDGKGVFTMDKGFPEISFLKDKTGYSKAGEINVYASVLSDNPIKRVDLSYKLIQVADEFDYANVTTQEKWVEIKNVSRAKSAETKLATIKTAGMVDGKYLLKAEIEDNKGNINEATANIIVDNKPPGVDLIFRPPGEGEKAAVVSGTYKELNLSELEVKIGNKAILPEISRQSRRFRFNYPLDSTDKIHVIIRDIGFNETKIDRDFIIDRDPPELVVNPVDVGQVKGNVVEITGTVKDANLDKIVILPDNIEASVKPTGADEYSWSAKTQVKKEGKYAYQISATDRMSNSTVKTLEIDFVSKITIVELQKDKIPDFTLKSDFEFSGIILGPPLKEFNIYNKTNDRRIAVNIKKDKSFSQIVNLVEGKNEFVMEKIFPDGHKEEDNFDITYSNQKVKARLDLKSNSFKEKLVSLKGSYDKGIIKVLINNQPVEMNGKDNTFKMDLVLKEGTNTVTLAWFDEINRFSKEEYTLHEDSSPPDIYVQALPDKTSKKLLNIRGKVSDNVASLISGYPGVEIQKIDPTTGEFEAIVKLQDGANNVHISALDPAGNRKEVLFHIDVDKSYPDVEVKEGAVGEELEFLRNEIERLKKELRERPVVRTQGGGGGGIDFSRVRLPSSPGLFLVPMAGRIKSYSLTAKVYLGNESLGVVIAKYNGRNPQELSRVLVPSPQLFHLISTSKNRERVEDIVQAAGLAFQKSASVAVVQKSILQYLIRSRSFKEAVNYGGNTILLTNEGVGILISQGRVNGKQIKTNLGLEELLVGNIDGQGIQFERY